MYMNAFAYLCIQSVIELTTAKDLESSFPKRLEAIFQKTILNEIKWK